jgi:hypothetical protein
MRNVNKVILLGYVERTPKRTTTESGNLIANLAMYGNFHCARSLGRKYQRILSTRDGDVQ